MRICLDSSTLCDGSPLAPWQLSSNGTLVVDEEHFYRAAAASFFPRGNRSTVLSLTVEQSFDSPAEAYRYALLRPSTVPASGVLAVDLADGSTLYLPDCACESVSPQILGVSVRTTYTLKGGLFTTDVPAELPGTVDAGGALVMRRASVPIAAGAESVAVTFSAPLSAAPVVTASISRPAGSATLGCSVRSDSITASGFTADLSAPTPDTTYRLDYLAVE